MFYLAGIVITFFLAFILWSKQGKSIADKVLAAWLCVMGFHLFLFYLFITGEIYKYPYLLGIQFPLPLVHGPLLYLYVITETRYNHFRNFFWLHFLPALLTLVLLMRFLRLSSAEKISVFQQDGVGFEMETNLITIATIISGFVYVFLSLVELNRYKKQIADEYSDIEKINLHWLRYLIFGILAIWLIVAFRQDDFIIFGAVVIFVILLGYFGIKHVGIFTYQQTLGVGNISNRKHNPSLNIKDDTPVTTDKLSIQDDSITEIEKETDHIEADSIGDETASLAGESKQKYERSTLPQEQADKIHHGLIDLMQTEKSYKESELTLAGLANRLSVHPHKLSQVINTYENKNFYDYVNLLRIEEFKHIVHLPKNRQFTLLSLAYEAGFNSKTAFNRNFKKITGQSPSDYLKAANIQLAE